MSTHRSSSKQSRTLTTDKIWTPQLRKTVRAIANSTVRNSKHSKTPVNVMTKRLQSLLNTFRTRAKKMAKSQNGRTRH